MTRARRTATGRSGRGLQQQQIIQMDLGHMPQGEVLRSIELLGTQVLPMVRDALT